MRALAVNGADLVIVPQAGAVDEWPEGLYEAEMRVPPFKRLLTALCNRVGKEDCLDFAGESFVCGPDGRVITAARRAWTRSFTAEVDFSELADCNARQLFLRHRRPELYPDWISRASNLPL